MVRSRPGTSSARLAKFILRGGGAPTRAFQDVASSCLKGRASRRPRLSASTDVPVPSKHSAGDACNQEPFDDAAAGVVVLSSLDPKG